jgi:hypothetical protein
VKHTHHDSSIEILLSDGDHNIPANTFKHFAAADDEAIGMETFNPSAFSGSLDGARSPKEPCFGAEGTGRRIVLDSIRLASGTGFVALDIVSTQKNSIAGHDFARFKLRNVADYDFL